MNQLNRNADFLSFFGIYNASIFFNEGTSMA